MDTAVYQVQMAPAQRVQSHTSHYHYHALGHCTVEPEETPGGCAPTEQWSKPKGGRYQTIEIGDAKQRKAKGIPETRAEGSPRIVVIPQA